MVEIIEPADAESVAIGYLSAALAAEPGFESVAVVGSLPATTADYEPPAECVVVRLTGGTSRDLLVDVPQLTLTSWAATSADEIRASDIARRAHAHLRAAERLGFMGATPVSEVAAFSLPYNDPDPTTGRARYSATYGVSMRGRVVRA
ncbi:tail terminator [Arthrobacter phage Andrew]|uniref:Tail terminator n=1 Tax=Arthrobacter phage Andrew TaxID=2419946 RepID=A0A3G2KCW8_9CAUD|nr:tail terminator [Arthrobacter phage Andrew]AYN56829.1 tail terminator [Arthrobacter phage Andrew]